MLMKRMGVAVGIEHWASWLMSSVDKPDSVTIWIELAPRYRRRWAVSSVVARMMALRCPVKRTKGSSSPMRRTIALAHS